MRRLSQGEADTRSQKPVHAGAKNFSPRPPQEGQSSPTRFETETRLNVSVGGTSRPLSLSRGSLAGDGWATNLSGCRSNLVCGAVALHGAFTFHAQVHPLDKFDPPGHRHAAVDRQQPRTLVRHRPVADVGLYLFRGMPSVSSVSLLVRSASALSQIRSTWLASAPHSSNADFWPASKYRPRASTPNPQLRVQITQPAAGFRADTSLCLAAVQPASGLEARRQVGLFRERPRRAALQHQPQALRVACHLR